MVVRVGLSVFTGRFRSRQASCQVGWCSASSFMDSAGASCCFIWNWTLGADVCLVDLPMMNQENVRCISASNGWPKCWQLEDSKNRGNTKSRGLKTEGGARIMSIMSRLQVTALSVHCFIQVIMT